VRVLPKMQTPQSGTTIRSLSLNLGLILGDEIIPKWHFLPEVGGKEFNILFVPWPLKVADGEIQPCKPNEHELENMPSDFGFFTYKPTGLGDPSALLKELLAAPSLKGHKIHAVVFPELAVTSDEFLALSQITQKKNMILISGVRVDQGSGSYSRNEVRFSAPDVETIVQQKHHRWKLDESQIETYKLQRHLDPNRQWWEHIDIASREFMFYALGDGLVFSTLICEDLARPDPVGDLLRAVGPNLVIALLLDGPQIKERWPGRYAASLANDPGSTVLSVTSFGMSAKSHVSDPKKDRKRIVALWQSPSKNESKEIELPDGASALFLSFERMTRKEWVADGRDDAGQSAYLHLKTDTPVRLGASK
jgi:hypothetical protein